MLVVLINFHYLLINTYLCVFKSLVTHYTILTKKEFCHYVSVSYLIWVVLDRIFFFFFVEHNLGHAGHKLGCAGCNFGHAGCNLGCAGHNLGRAGHKLGCARCNLGRVGCNFGHAGHNLGHVGYNLGHAGYNLGCAGCNYMKTVFSSYL